VKGENKANTVREVKQIKNELCVKKMEIQIIHIRRQSYTHQDQRENQAYDTMIVYGLWTG
jgi:hypothetical protein